MQSSSYDGTLTIIVLQYEIREYNIKTPVNATAGMETLHSSNKPLAKHAYYRIIRMMKILQQEDKDVFVSGNGIPLESYLALSVFGRMKLSKTGCGKLLFDIVRWVSMLKLR